MATINANATRLGSMSVTTAKKTCLTSGCEDTARTKGYCARHYMWMKRHDPVAVFGKKLICESDGCDKPQNESRLCREHFLERRRFREKLAREMRIYDGTKYVTKHERDGRPIPDDLWEFVKYELELK